MRRGNLGVAMHDFTLSQTDKDLIIKRRGRLHAFESLEPARTALLVVDMQNAFVKEELAHAYVAEAASIAPNINTLASALRGGGGSVVWIKNTFTEESLESWSHFHEELWAPGRKERRIAAMSEGTVGHHIYDGLDVLPEDLEINKTRYSAFIQGSSDLAATLREREVDTVLVTGTVTNVCCESTGRDAMMLNFRTIMVSDANAAGNDDAHQASLASFWTTFGDVRSTAEVVDLIAAAAATREAAE